MSIRPLILFPEELHPTPAVDKRFGGVADNRAQLLELRTESGVLYICPSRWERIRLRWAFRHFYVLPPQVLSRRNQLLIERLSRSALVTPPLPVAREAIFGVVERARTKATEVGRVIPMRAPEPGPQLAAAKGSASVSTVAAKYSAPYVHDAGFRQWKALGLLAAVSLVVIVARVSGVFPASKTPVVKQAPAVSRPIEQAAAHVSTPVAPPPVVLKPTHRLPAPAPEPTLVARASTPPVSVPEPPIVGSTSAVPHVEDPVVPAASEEPLFVAGLPQGHLVEPIVSDPNLVGELHLKALIGADGAVKDVTVVSGDPKLAEAGMRAVRRWHYGQYQALGRQGEGEALIRMNFFGEDAVSISADAR
jgi:Gram-negative bacterial TonB protein C-terminal